MERGTVVETRKWRQESVDYVEASVTAKPGETLVGSTVTVSIKKPGVADTWLPAGWVGTPTTTGIARTSSLVALTAAAYPQGDYTVRVKVAVGGESHIHECYYAKVTA